MKRDGLGRNWYGGNSGYIGYSKSKRAAEAERRGLRNKSQMNREFLEEVNELLPPERRVTLKKIKENLDNMRYDEWHHTSKYGNKTYYYSAETVAEYFEENSDERKEEKRNKEKHKEWLLQCLKVAQERLVIHAKSYADMLGYVSLEKDKHGNKHAYFRASNGLVVVSFNLNEHYQFVYEGVLQENNVSDEYVNYYSNPKGLILRRDIFVLGDKAKTEEMHNLANEAEKEYFKMLDKLYNDVRVMPYKKEYEEAEKMYNEFRFQNLKGTGMAKITRDNMSDFLDEVAKYANAEFLPLYKDAIDMLEFYDEDADIKENVDMTIEYANELLEKNAPKKEEKGGKTEDFLEDLEKKYEEYNKKEAEESEEDETSKPKPEKKPKKVSKPKAEKKPKAKKEDNAERVAAITPEKKIIGDFCKLASFSGTASALKDKVRLLLNRLQNAIVQKQIRKTSKYANEIMSIQTKLVSFLNSGATGKVKVEINNLDELMKIAKSEKVSENVMIARAFIRLNNKSDKMKEATALLKRINKAIEADIANEEVKMLKPSLESFISKKTKAVEPSERALRGLYGLAGVEDGAAANSMQLINQHYDVMTLSGRWKDFIGRPSKNFKMMVYGKPGQGKSTFSILFARYLAKEKGLRVLYVAAEEKFGYTLQEKIKRLEALTPNLDFAEDLTFSDLPNYDVVLLDSVNHLQMDADELATLPQNCAYVWIFQSTKEGNYKGGQQYAHDSDTVIKVDSMKARTEKNRFGAANMEFDIEDTED